MKHIIRYLALLAVLQFSALPLYAEQGAQDHGHDHGHNHAHEHSAAESSKDSEIKSTETKRLWCKEHQLHEDECFICHPELREKGRLWCNEHGRYEDRCWLCHPEIEDKEREYCNTHYLYADECAHLHPENAQKHSQKSDKNVTPTKSAELFCKEHDLPERECGICHPELLSSLNKGDALKLRLPSEESIELVGITSAPPESMSVEDAVACVGELRFNENRTAHIVAPVRGVIKEVHVDLGASLSSGSALASIWSPAIAEATSNAILSAQTLARVQRLRKKGISSAKDLERAQANNRSAVQRLQSLGFSDKQISSLKTDGNAPTVLSVTAPFDGEVVERSSVQGEFVEAGAPLFTVTDKTTLWAMLSIPAAKLGLVKKGQTVKLKTSAFSDEEFTGTLTWISASIDSKTRMVKARAEVENTDGRLRDNMFVNARIVTRQSNNAYLVPNNAVQTIEDINFVFVKLHNDLFQIQPVELGATSGDKIEIISGLSKDSNIVSDRSHVLKSQFLISRLGAGCVH
jgi:cobalt-zinc-cadmium efflux system membrane fusion protein